mgnify:CR=1 FL=1
MQKQGLSSLALQKFKKSFWGVFSFWFIMFMAFISVFAYVLAPDSSQYSNQMHLSIHSKKPGFKVDMLTIPSKLKTNQGFMDKIFFGKNQELDIPAGVDALCKKFNEIEPGSGVHLLDFLKEGKLKYEVGMNNLVHKPGLSVTELFDVKIVISGAVSTTLIMRFEQLGYMKLHPYTKQLSPLEK